MSEYLREAGRKRAAAAGPPGRLARAGVSGTVVGLGVLGVVLLVVALVLGHPVAIAGAMAAIGSALLWWRSNRRQLSRADQETAGPAEVRLAFGSLVALLVGMASWAIGMIKGW